VAFVMNRNCLEVTMARNITIPITIAEHLNINTLEIINNAAKTTKHSASHNTKS
jgi:hypothetical protein